MTDPFAALDALIDDYLAHERRQRPRLGYPSRAAGTEAAGSNRSWESADELLEDSVAGLRMAAMSGAWASISIRQERAIRIDASNRRASVSVFRIAGLTPAQTESEVRSAKTLLRGLLLQRNILV